MDGHCMSVMSSDTMEEACFFGKDCALMAAAAHRNSALSFSGRFMRGLFIGPSSIENDFPEGGTVKKAVCCRLAHF